MAARKKAVATKEDTTAMLAEQIRGMGMQINLQMPDTPEQAWAMVRREENEAALNMARRGMLYLYLKDQLPHGEFENGLEEMGIPPRRAQEAMQVARMLAKLPSPTLKKLAPVSGRKLIELARLPIETLEEMNTEGELDDIDKMSVRELKENLRRERMSREKAENRHKALLKAQKKANALAAIDGDDKQWHELTRAIRREADALAEQASLAADGLSQLAAKLMEPLQELDQANYQAATSTLYHQTRSAFAKLSYLLTMMQNNFDITESDSDLPFYSEEEAAQAMATRSLLLGEHRARESARADSKGPAKRTRGRKAGNK